MNKTESTLLVILALVLLVILGVVGWRHYGVALQNRFAQEASVSATLSGGDFIGSASTGTIITNPSTTFTTSSILALTTSSISSATKPSSTTASLSSSSVSTSASSALIIPQAGWTTYREDQYGVAGTYPQPWYEYDAVGLGGSLQFGSLPQNELTSGGFVVNGAAEITVYRTQETVMQAEAEDTLNSSPEAKTTATVGGETVSVIAYNTASSEDTMTAYVPHDGYVYRIVLSYHGESSFSSIYSNFLSTFRFSN